MLTNQDIPVCQIHTDTALLISKCFILHRHFLFAIDFETYYPQPPRRPLWVHSMCEKILKLRPKRFPIQEAQVHEQFKKFFGYKIAIKCRVSRTLFLCFNLHYFVCFCTHIKSVRNIDIFTGPPKRGWLMNKGRLRPIGSVTKSWMIEQMVPLRDRQETRKQAGVQTVGCGQMGGLMDEWSVRQIVEQIERETKRWAD